MAQTYPLVNELELEVAPTTVWVGLSAGLQPVPLILPAAQVLAAGSGDAHAHEWGQGGARRQTWSPAPAPLPPLPCPTHLEPQNHVPQKVILALVLAGVLENPVPGGVRVRERGPEPEGPGRYLPPTCGHRAQQLVLGVWGSPHSLPGSPAAPTFAAHAGL